MRLRLFLGIVLASLPVRVSWTQGALPIQPHPTPRDAQSLLPEAPVPKTTEPEEKPQRLFWIIPTFTVSNNKTPTALSSRQKFRMFFNNNTDPFTVTSIALSAGWAQANNNLAGYGQGAAGYAKRFGAGMADQSASGFFRTFLFPSLLHQDPRYFRKGSGPWRLRFAHALIRPVITNTDSQRKAFNWSGLLGGLAASALANTYYPEEERGVGKTISRVEIGIPSSAIDHLVDEFGPDLQQKLMRDKRQPDQ